MIDSQITDQMAIHKRVLSDGSPVFDLVITDGVHTVTIGCHDEDSATDIARAIEDRTSFIEVD